jgi:hypothetical protein
MKTVLKQLDKEIGKAYYEACKQLLTPLTDREFEKLCAKHNELFSKLSTLDHSKIEEFIPEMRQVIQIMQDYNKGLSIEEFEAMTMDEVVDYVSSLIYSKGKINLYNLVKELEKL